MCYKSYIFTQIFLLSINSVLVFLFIFWLHLAFVSRPKKLGDWYQHVGGKKIRKKWSIQHPRRVNEKKIPGKLKKKEVFLKLQKKKDSAKIPTTFPWFTTFTYSSYPKIAIFGIVVKLFFCNYREFLFFNLTLLGCHRTIFFYVGPNLCSSRPRRPKNMLKYNDIIIVRSV